MHAGPCAGALEAVFINPTPGHDLPIFRMFRHRSPSAQFKVSISWHTSMENALRPCGVKSGFAERTSRWMQVMPAPWLGAFGLMNNQLATHFRTYFQMDAGACCLHDLDLAAN